MNAIAPSQDSSPNAPSSTDEIISASWRLISQSQAPPPSVREILGAYNSRGEGDREMLLALLTAKSAEEQRLASTAALHRTLLEIHYRSQPPPLHPPTYAHPHSSPHPSLYDMDYSPPSPHLPRRSAHSSSPPIGTISPTTRESGQPPRKRPRSVPAASEHSDSSTQSASSPPVSMQSPSSPRSRTSMAIGSLLSPSASEANGDVTAPARSSTRIATGRHRPIRPRPVLDVAI